MKNNKNETTIGALKIKTFEPAAEGFDPLTASAAKLAHHGIVPRPDKDKEPDLYKKWHKVYSKNLKHIVPEFVRNENKQHRPMKDRKDHKNGASTSTNWSGAVVFNPANDSFKWITGNWIVPDVNQPAGEPTGEWYYSSAWVGIDGDGSGDVLQAGTESDMLLQNGVLRKQIAAWWEWYPEYSVNISNLPVSSGDYMTCLICVTSPTTASFYFTNITTSTHTSFQITAPAGTVLAGNCAEWILEAPTVNGGQSALADYGATFFDESYAYTQKNVEVNAGSGSTINMVNSANTVISETLVETPQLIKVSFE
jgi:hypothetical protein